MRNSEDKQLDADTLRSSVFRMINRDRKDFILFLDALEGYFPNKGPLITDEERMIWFKAGQSSVVGFLDKLYKDSSEQSLER